MADPVAPETLLDEDGVRAVVDALADRIAPVIDDEAVAVCLLTGGIWFAADLTRALARRGRMVGFDALWLASYGDGKTSRGVIEERAGLQRDVTGKTVLILDDVFDTGLSLKRAAEIVEARGAARVLTCVFASKPWPEPRALEPDFVGWQAPARYLVGYGLDSAGRMRGLPSIVALD
ncbi:MAG: phosphoribosyltransferase [Caulobacterales bacterium]|nr:phosphoribosyltransferase [Caulobacterales bacterium]